jgi:pimeloyl-ACP methyl ester carboxylesterase
MDLNKQLGRSHEIGVKVGLLSQKRTKIALEKYTQRVSEALRTDGPEGRESLAQAVAMRNPWNASQYAVDAMQRSILFWQTLRERGNNFVERNAGGFEPLLHFAYETVVDGRALARPVNYALLRITPPDGVTIDPRKRPYLIIDPRAGHGPGIGGFKDDSQVGVALRAGHPVYFVIFYRDPEPGQTLLDVCTAEQQFVKKVRSLHPDSEKPAIIGNCQGGWAAMMLGSSSADDTGPIIVVGAPMSYWGGAWDENQVNNPMRYAGGMLGGTWLSSLTADMGNGKFDGAYLVQNFEYLNPANTYWDKYYKLYRNIDTEQSRFLDFERWWGSYYLMNREEIEWITRNLFIGNKLWSGEVKAASGKVFDLREIQSPIILFASLGDNITPAQQAFNWVADMYGSTEEIKARGQVIVGLTHQDVGHLGIFVSGKVAKKEHAQIVSVLEEVELLPPGLYGMEIT